MIMKPLSCIFFFEHLLVALGLELEPCGRPRIQPVLDEEDRIYRGREAVPGSWPWHAGIYTNALFPFFICSGVLVSEKHVLTARHCLLKKSPATIRVHLGAHMRDKEDAGEESYLVEEICAHPLYQPPNTNDIAVLTLREKVKFTETILTVCLPQNMAEIVVNSETYVTGWGRFQNQGREMSPYLKQFRTKIVSNKTCNQVYKGQIPESVTCSGHDFGSSCKGDSGGPMVQLSGSIWLLQGIVSGGPSSCGLDDDPLLFTKVSYFVDNFISIYTRAKTLQEKNRVCALS
uniref:limulus clotting factor C n=1 Tax=Ixodes scapularis TaxID=6945 RepID=A0A4D5RRM1_IXOSC